VQTRLGRLWPVTFAAPLLLSACHDRSSRSDVQVRNAGFANRDTARVLGPGDIRIVSLDSSIELTLAGDTVMTGLAAKALAKVKAETDTGAVAGTGFSAKLEKMIKSSVQSALSKQLTSPVASVSDVRFDGATLQLLDASGRRMASFGGTGTDSTSHGGKFAPADAQAFIAAFRARKTRQATNR
jgi:hypothetical protein